MNIKNVLIALLVCFAANPAIFAIALHPLNKTKCKKVFLNRTFTSIATDNLNGLTIDNTFSMFLDDRGHIFGKMSHKPKNEPQTDTGVYTLTNDGTFYITWKHWDGAKELCGHIFDTKNAYISVDCNNVFHTVFMKEASQIGNKLK